MANDMLSNTSKEMDDSLPYYVREGVLHAAEQVLSHLPEEEIQALADRFNDHSEEP